ncbi:MAG: OmpA family protein [Ignavibacteriaceae bacterium]|nr:OmpA family protein [Ignavibacteriaceae bacterium]
MKKIFSIFVFFVVLTQICSGQDNTSTKYFNPMSNNLALTAEGGITIGQTDYKDIRLNYLVKGSLEYYFYSDNASLFGLRAYGGTGIVSGKDDSKNPVVFKSTIYYLGLGVSYTYSIEDVFYPFISVGFLDLYRYTRNWGGNKIQRVGDDQMGAITGELGARYMVSDNVSINLSGTLIDGTKDYLDNYIAGSHNDLAYAVTAGASYYFNRTVDSDGDGVPDNIDKCPNTPHGVKVDDFGCPLDADGDGVPDYLDKCPNTPAGVKVDVNGCPLDSDEDGVPDYLDKCPNTPVGVKVDESGCPLDADGDGVPDYLDKCPNTPTGVKVDAVGCPLDSDGDGVPDYLDKCPNTPAGVKVDASGCPIKKAEIIKKFTLKGDANFESGKSDLLPRAYPVLDSLVASMKDNPNHKWTIEGYTDSKGSNKLNMNLSKQRAQTVADYLVSKGIDKNSLEIKAFGKANPVANNKTADGRAMNRRVEIKLAK